MLWFVLIVRATVSVDFSVQDCLSYALNIVMSKQGKSLREAQDILGDGTTPYSFSFLQSTV